MNQDVMHIPILIALFWLFTANSFAAIIPAPPGINAVSYLVKDFNSGRILAEKDINKRVEPASLTKMMTAYIVANEIQEGSISPEDMVLVHYSKRPCHFGRGFNTGPS